MALTKEQIKEFKEAEKKKAEEACELIEIADEIADAGDKEWAKKVYKKVEGKAENSTDFLYLAESICQRLGDKKWAKVVYKKAEDKAEEYSEYESLVESIRDNLGDKKWAKLLDQKAKELEGKEVLEVNDFADSSESIQAKIVLPECTLDYEIVNRKDIESIDKLLPFIKRFAERKDHLTDYSECHWWGESLPIADDITSIENEDGIYIAVHL
jgi:hypothetical protein